MESVEEICEYIALLHNAEKILDGKLSEIKREYKNNIFSVGMAVADGDRFLKELSDSFQIDAAHYNRQDSQLVFQIQLPSDDTRSLVTHLSSKGTINNFVETIPTANDIFIKTVQSKTVHE